MDDAREATCAPGPPGAVGSVAILGGTGFLGRALAEALERELSARGGEVLCLSRSVGGEGARRSPWSGAPGGLRAVRADALRGDEVERALDREGPRAVVLCSALARLDECERYPGLARALNVELPGRVGRWCAAARARLLHVSTDLVFGACDPPPGGFGEDHAVGPTSLYGETKAAGEASLAELHPASLVVRLPLLYGDSRGRGLGASDAPLAALARGEAPVFFEDEWRTPLDVDVAAAALTELVLDGSARGLLHVAGARRMSRAELGALALAAAGIPFERARRGTRAQAGLERSRPRDVSLDCARARALLRTPLGPPA